MKRWTLHPGALVRMANTRAGSRALLANIGFGGAAKPSSQDSASWIRRTRNRPPTACAELGMVRAGVRRQYVSANGSVMPNIRQ